jgi:cell division protein FtsQ
MPQGAQSDFSFPVVMGMSDNEPLSTRAPRMKIYNQLIRQLDWERIDIRFLRDR